MTEIANFAIMNNNVLLYLYLYSASRAQNHDSWLSHVYTDRYKLLYIFTVLGHEMLVIAIAKVYALREREKNVYYIEFPFEFRTNALINLDLAPSTKSDRCVRP